VGTVFSEDQTAPPASFSLKSKQKETTLHYQKIEKAQESGNNSLALSLASFFCPGVGFILAGASIAMAVFALKTLKHSDSEEGRGSATAALVIGSLGIVAQICCVIYVIKIGLPF
jgi:hypothetical protein